MENYNLHKKRLRQLRFNSKKEETEVQEIIDKITNPVSKTVATRLSVKDMNSIEKKLKIAQWDKNISPQQFASLQVITKILAIVFFALFYKQSKFIAILWGGILFVGLEFLLNNSAKNRKERIMMGFPDFIRITQGYLSANMPFVKSVEESIKFVNKEWQEILQQFVVECELSSIEEALENLKQETDIFEIKEFVSLIRLTLEQGGGAKEGFESQAEKIQELLHDVILMKIGNRKMMGIIIQGPLLLCNIAVLALPTIDAMLNLNTM